MTSIYLITFILLDKDQSNVLPKGLITDLVIEYLENISKKTDYIHGYYS